MLVPITLLILALLASVAIGIYTAKKRVFDDEQPPDIRPDDPRPPTGPRAGGVPTAGTPARGAGVMPEGCS